MTTYQKRTILERMAQTQENIDILKQARIEAVANGFASATISTTGGSKSYSRISPEQITKVIDELLKELEQLRNMLATGRAKTIHTIPTVYIG